MKERSEESLYEDLTSLVHALYRGQEAIEIIEAFKTTLMTHKDVNERMRILAYWCDYYQLRRYQRDRQRQRPTYRERTTPCAACGYPSSHRHHIYDVATHGENFQTVQLCANCHELQHLLYNALVNSSEYSKKLINHMMYSERLLPTTLEKLLMYCRATIRYEAKHGWVSAEKASDDWVELTLHWSEYRRHTSV
jgi:ribosomal protein L37E